jgi:hypothetical protein
MSSTSDDENIGAEAEKEFELENEALKPKPRRVKLTNGQRLKLIDAYRQGKTDKFYNVIPDKKKPGDFRIVRRRKPLDVPIADNEPIDMNIQATPTEPVPQTPAKEDKSEKNKLNMEFYTMQNTINNSLSKEIAAVMEKCNKIERKLKEQKQMKKEKQRSKKQEIIEEYIDDDDEVYNEPMEEEPMYQQPQRYLRDYPPDPDRYEPRR